MGLSDPAKAEPDISGRKGIERLHSAENELRNARVLVSLDSRKGELFTFYRKEDLQRDAKSIFNRVVTILRKNGCHMSSKNAIKTTDLLRPDRGKLHRLFMYAILCMIKSEVKQDENLIAFDLNVFLFQKPDGPMHETGDVWELLDLSTQLLPSGQVITMSRQDTSTMFKRVSSIPYREGNEVFLRRPSKILLALTGQYARYVGGYVGKLPHSVDTTAQGTPSSYGTREASLERYRQQIWKASVEQWLAENEQCFRVKEDVWVELEVPLCEAVTENPTSTDGLVQMGKVIWKPIFWPTSLCYVNVVDQHVGEGTEPSSPRFEDPLQFLEDWVASAADREAAIRKMKQDLEVSMKPGRVGDSDMPHNNNIHVEAGQSLRRVTSLDGHVAAIYPTPPDGALLQVTPGVFSGDGLTGTPGAPDQPDRTEPFVEMTNLVGDQAAIGSGLYDEDLFDDVPGEKFREAEMADEPNWDFFNEPDPEMTENTDHAALDIPENVASAVAEDRTFGRIQIEQRLVEPENVLHKNNHDVGRSELDQIRDSKSMPLGRDGTMHTVRDRSKGPEMAESRPAGLTSQPLSPTEVRKKLFTSMASQNPYAVQQTNAAQPNRRSLLDNHWNSNVFQPDLKATDRRYRTNGSFWFEAKGAECSSATNSAEQHLTMPRIGIPKKEQSASGTESPSGSEPPESTSSAEDFDSSEFFSESNKRDSPDRSNQVEADALPVSPQPAEDILDSDTESRIREEMVEILALLRSDFNEHLFAETHEPLQRHYHPSLPVSREKFLTVTQVLVDQVSQSIFHSVCPDNYLPLSETRHLDTFQQPRSIYGDATELDVAKLAEMSTGSQGAAEENGLEESPSPFVRLARADANLDALPTIQPFWETLGLQPVSGKKNITALFIHPAGKHIEEGSLAFLQRISDLYANCNLGCHTTATLQDVTSNGLVEWDFGKESRMHELLQICERLGSSLSTIPSSTESLIIYIVNPFKDRTGLADICSAFVALYTTYAKACGKSKGNKLNLQIIPMSFIASSDKMVIPSQAEYLSLALEVYNRCPLRSSNGAVAESGSAVRLAEPVPKHITFNFTSDATSPLFKDGETLHLAYSQSVDHRWLTACWTDNLGKTALTMTYCLCQKGSTASRPRSEVIEELWGISQDIMINTRGRWRLLVAHEGPVEPDEINEWCFLANQQASTGSAAQCVLTLLTFDRHPSIQFCPPASHSKPQPPPTATTGKYGTPASTPSAAVAMTSSPEQFTALTPIPHTPGTSGLLTAPTPPDQSHQAQIHGFDTTRDPGATLLDPSDECWSLVLPFGLNNSNSPLDSRPALLSGFLLKRRGPLDSDGLVSLGVNLIYTSADTATKAEHKAVLKKVIDQWRGLHTLARTKSLGGSGSVLPWHVRTAIVGCRAVSEVF